MPAPSVPSDPSTPLAEAVAPEPAVTSAPAPALAPEPAPTEYELHHPTLADITLTVPASHLDEALLQGWLRRPPRDEDLAEVVVETGTDEPPAETTADTATPAGDGETARVAVLTDQTVTVTPPVSTTKPGPAASGTDKPSGSPRS